MTESEQIVDLFRKTLALARKHFNQYFLTLALINGFLAIDLLTDAQFLSGSAKFKMFGLEIPRIAFSAAFSLGFFLFVLWAAHITNVLDSFLEKLGKVEVDRRLVPELKLWWLSPVSENALTRALFWLVASDGLAILLVISVIHLGGFMPPGEDSLMSKSTYRVIGIVPAVVLLTSIYIGYSKVFPVWTRLASQLGKSCEA